jgi:peroxin-11B
MASVASQLILHPTVSHTLKVTATTVGRDKVRIIALAQYISLRPYVSRSIAQFNTLPVFLHGIFSPKVTRTTLPDGMLSNLISALPVNVSRHRFVSCSACPRSYALVLRLGKPLEHLQAALRASQTTGVFGEQVTAIGRQLAYFGYLAYDTAIWVCEPVPLIRSR